MVRLILTHLSVTLLFVKAFTLPHKTSAFIAPFYQGTSLTFRNEGHVRAPTCQHAYPPRKNRKEPFDEDDAENEDEDDDYDPVLDEPRGRRGDGRNWIEKSSPIGIGELGEGAVDDKTNSKEKRTDGYYDIGVHGESFQTGSLSARMYDALMSVARKRFSKETEIPSELQDVYKIYAMDITAKEAVKAALDQNGLELAIDESDDVQDEGLWGDIDSVHLLDPNTGEIEEGTEEYDSFDSAVEEGDWEPGQPFNFIVRNVPARLKELDISDLLSKLDPDGKLRSEAREKGITMPDEDVASLRDLGKECDRRTKIAPYETQDESTVYKGDGSKGYLPMKRSDLLLDSINMDGTENDATLMHVMDALVSHSCLIVDLTDGGTRFGDAIKMKKMWDASSKFFQTIQNDNDAIKSLPNMKKAEGTGSPHAMIGFESYGDGSMQFLETRISRGAADSRKIVPDAVANLMGDDNCISMIEAFDLMCDVGKDIVRIAVAAANMEYSGFLSQNTQDEEISDLPAISGLTFDDQEIAGISTNDDAGSYVTAARLSSEAANLMVNELIDDGKTNLMNKDEEIISMSPHRICRYEGKTSNADKKDEGNTKETFGAHTDTSFMTLVPVAEVSGLEVFDDDANKWFRPELLARQIWEKDRELLGQDPTSECDTIKVFDGEEDKVMNLPWHCRYVVAMPGEFLQITTRNEVAAAVHRVVSVKNGQARMSAPVLLRARSGMRMNLSKYFGNLENTGSLLRECDGMKLEDIHSALQPSNYRAK